MFSGFGSLFKVPVYLLFFDDFWFVCLFVLWFWLCICLCWVLDLLRLLVCVLTSSVVCRFRCLCVWCWMSVDAVVVLGFDCCFGFGLGLLGFVVGGMFVGVLILLLIWVVLAD